MHVCARVVQDSDLKLILLNRCGDAPEYMAAARKTNGG